MIQRLRTGAVALTAVLLALLAWRIPTTDGAYTASVTNSTDTSATNTYFNCTNAAKGDATVYKPAFFAYPFGESAGVSAADVSGNGRTGTYTNTGITYGVANGGVCPRDNKTVITLNGSTGFIDGPVTGLTSGSAFSLEAWFRTTTKGGTIIETANVGLGTPDRIIYINTSGQVVFGVNPFLVGRTVIASAASTYADGNWHHVVATLSGAGMALYVDDKAAVTNTSITAAGIVVGTPNWRIGTGDCSSWTGGSTNNSYTGNLAFTAVYTYAMTPAQELAHYYAGR